MRWTDCPSRNITWEGKRGSTSKNEFKLGGDITYSNTPNIFANIACVASVSRGFRTNFDVLAARKLGREQKRKRGEGERRKGNVRQRTGLVIGSALVLIIDMCPSKI